MREHDKITVIMATFNSEEKLPRTLERLYAQDFPREKLEVLVMDGGSTDRTREIATKFGATVMDNPYTVPGWAKYIGLHAAKGRIALFLDSDEAYAETKSLANIAQAFRDNSEVHLVTSSGYRSPEGYPFINSYINEFGDPFSYFIYRLSKDARFYLRTMRKRYRITKETEQYAVFDLAKADDLPLIEMYAMSSAIDVDYFEKEFPEAFRSQTEFSHVFNLFMARKPVLAIAKDSDIYHYSADSVKSFLSKVNWRIRSNIAFEEIAERGFKGRSRYQKMQTKVRKYAFLPFTLLILPLVIDALHLCVTRRNFRYLGHVYLSLHTAFSILYYFARHKLGWSLEHSAYGTSIKVSEHREAGIKKS
ncbi:MAG: glycosyltransferase family A protein [Bdellovibrionota bacterium]